ncbi:MAG TPA: hypothetical protein VN365_03140 [Candidatus Thermoplasmatota archaeon]|nr:hypothetical protein [Candidatus Thermoplasmatota archaeon]
MDKKPLIGISICAVVLLVLGSLNNVVGYQSVQTSQQNIIKDRINQRELLFQTIVDISNNKEIQRIIIKSQMSRGVFPTSEIPVVTKNQLKMMYFIGLILSKVVSKSRMQSMVQQYQLLNPITQEEMIGIIEKDVILKNEITQLQNSDCNCGNKTDEEKISKIEVAYYKIICGLLFILWVGSVLIMGPFEVIFVFLENMELIGLEKLFYLIILPIVLPLGLIFFISFTLFIVFGCWGYFLP